MKIAVLVSGRGSNLRAILEAQDAGSCAVDVVAVVADRAGAPALELAGERRIPSVVVSFADYTDRGAWDLALANTIASFLPEVVVLAGFMRIVGEHTLTCFAGRIVNVHPALLPAFAGMDAPAQAVEKRVAVSGCTVHVVDQGVDTGPILAQAVVPVLAADDAASLHARIQRAEHRLLPAVLHAIAERRIELLPEPRFAGFEGTLPVPFFWPPVVRS